jgi:hypothetical protein
MKYPDGEIIEKARTKITDLEKVDEDILDITVDFEDADDMIHSYVVSFKRDPFAEAWRAFDITEVSTQG